MGAFREPQLERTIERVLFRPDPLVARTVLDASLQDIQILLLIRDSQLHTHHSIART